MEEHAFESHDVKYRIRIGPGAEFANEIESILAFLVPRAHVKAKFLIRHIPGAQVLAIAETDGEIVSVCALKGVNREHTSSVVAESAYPLELDRLELGYAATHEEHAGRGLGSHLNAEILSRTETAVYATVRVGNSVEERNLRRCDFCQAGEPWKRTDESGGEYAIRLWIRGTPVIRAPASSAD